MVETELTKDLLADEEYARTMKARIPMGRWAKPEDIVGPTHIFCLGGRPILSPDRFSISMEE